MIDRIVISGTCAGADGSSTFTAYSPHVKGKIQAVHISYVGDDPATTDVTLADEADPASESIVSLTDNATDIKLYPRRLLETNDGTDLTYDGTRKIYAPYIVHGRLKLVVAQANLGDVITATIWIES